MLKLSDGYSTINIQILANQSAGTTDRSFTGGGFIGVKMAVCTSAQERCLNVPASCLLKLLSSFAQITIHHHIVTQAPYVATASPSSEKGLHNLYQTP